MIDGPTQKHPRPIVGMAARIRAAELDENGKNKIARSMGHNGGTHRAANLSAERLSAIGREAALARWHGKKPKGEHNG